MSRMLDIRIINIISVLSRYGENVEIVVDEKNSTTKYQTKGLIEPLYHSNNPCKPLTDYQKQFFRLTISPNATISHTKKTLVICGGKKYEVRNVNNYKARGKTIYKWAVLRLQK